MRAKNPTPVDDRSKFRRRFSARRGRRCFPEYNRYVKREEKTKERREGRRKNDGDMEEEEGENDEANIGDKKKTRIKEGKKKRKSSLIGYGVT